MRHEVTFHESGSWKQTLMPDGDSVTIGNRHDHQREVFVEAECTCGKEFSDADEAYDHALKKAREGEQ